MASRVIMPKLTDSMEEGVVVKWCKAEGERVESGDVLAEIETDKAVMDLEAFASGVLRKILVPEGATVLSGALIGVIAEPDEEIEGLLAEQSLPSKPALAAKQAPAAMSAASAEASPAATPAAPMREIPLTQMRKAIVRATTQSKAPVPHFYVTIEVDMADGLGMVEDSKKPPARAPISLNHLVLAAAARALTQHPGINAAFAGETIRLFSRIDIGIAVALTDGLIVPVLRDCGHKTLAQIVETERALVTRAKNRDLSPEDCAGATFLISNLGAFDVESFSAVILPPAAAVLAVGSVRDVPVVRDGRVEAGHRMKVTMSCDHRVIDGAAAAQFLHAFKQAVEQARDL